MNNVFESEPIQFKAIPVRRVLASNLGEAGRAVVRAKDSHVVQELPSQLSHNERVELDADLKAIDEAQRIGLETGSRYIIGLAGR